mmetsp:Transcript_102091/g.164536  ORF Transcript_102091/g.164536 Transcript_102091/m.164536 type:complete len:89 (+) Transcript_102091:240-506(+)
MTRMGVCLIESTIQNLMVECFRHAHTKSCSRDLEHLNCNDYASSLAGVRIKAHLLSRQKQMSFSCTPYCRHMGGKGDEERDISGYFFG